MTRRRQAADALAIGIDHLPKAAAGTVLIYLDRLSRRIMARLSDGTVRQLDVPAGGGSGAPTTVDYLVRTADAGLSAERVVTDTASLVWAWGTAGQAKADVQFGSTGTVACVGNDARLSDARTPTAHTHVLADITDEGTMAAVNDAPSDGSTYGRNNGAWAAVGVGFVIENRTSDPGAPVAGQVWLRTDL